MRKKYELYEIKKYYNEYQQGRGLGVYSGREEAVAAIPYIIPGNPRSREISAREMPDSLNFAPDVVYHIVCEGGAEGYWGIVETEIPDRDTDAVKAHLEHNPWLAQPYQNFVRLERECCGMTISPGLDDTALYYLAQNLRGAFSIAGVPEDYFAFLKLVGGFAYYGRFELYADNLITKNRAYNPEAVRGAVFEPEKKYIRLGFCDRGFYGDKPHFAYLLYGHKTDGYYLDVDGEITPFASCSDMLDYFVKLINER